MCLRVFISHLPHTKTKHTTEQHVRRFISSHFTNGKEIISNIFFIKMKQNKSSRASFTTKMNETIMIDRITLFSRFLQQSHYFDFLGWDRWAKSAWKDKKENINIEMWVSCFKEPSKDEKNCEISVGKQHDTSKKEKHGNTLKWILPRIKSVDWMRMKN